MCRGRAMRRSRVHSAVAEGGQRLRARCAKRARELVRGGDKTHALATASGNCLDHHRVADAAGDL